MLFATTLMRGDSPSPTQINILLFTYMLTYYPTLALTNSLALHAISDPEKEFPFIRVFGTIGWIVAGIALAGLGLGDNIGMFYLAGFAALLLGLYSFSLPHTPPPAKGEKISAHQVLGLDALVLLKQPSYLAFMISSFLICIPLAFYYQLAERTVTQTGLANSAFIMTFGQMSEIFFMLVMPLFFARLGVKWMLFVGMFAWVARYVLFAVGAPNEVVWMVILGVVLHGICYDFFFVTGQIYTDKAAPKAIRSQAQGMLVLFTLGLGMFIGAKVAGRVEAYYTPSEFQTLNQQAQDTLGKIDDLGSQIAQASPEEAKQLQTELDSLVELKNTKSVEALKTLDWKMIWGIPAMLAAAIMIVFALVFYDDEAGTVAEDAVA